MVIILQLFSNLDNPPVLGVIVAVYQMVLVFLLPVILMSSSYYRVITALWRSTKSMSAMTNTRAENTGYLMDTKNHSMMETDIVTHSPYMHSLSPDENIYKNGGSFNRTFRIRSSFRNNLHHGEFFITFPTSKGCDQVIRQRE